jgi:single-strand DNA-binding protein
MLNIVALIGRLGADPEIRYTPSGVPVANFRIVVNEYWTDQSGEKKERTHWFSCVAWKGLAETIERYLSKGSQVGISGSLQSRRWREQTDAGETRSTVEIVVRNLTMLDNKRQDEAPPIEDSDIPF